MQLECVDNGVFGVFRIRSQKITRLKNTTSLEAAFKTQEQAEIYLQVLQRDKPNAEFLVLEIDIYDTADDALIDVA